MSKLIYVILILGIIVLCMVIYKKFADKFKNVKMSCVTLVTGGVKCGKSTFAVSQAITKYKQAHRSWKIRSYFQKLLHLPIDEEPLLYSNIPLATTYVPLTKDLLLRNTRFRYHSVVYVCEASLVADKELYKECGESENERVMFFNKLFGHETHNGILIYDTQCVGDLSINVRRCLSDYIYIHHLTTWIPFFLIAHVREERYSEDLSVTSNYTEDVENSLKRVILLKRNWKYFDAFCYSKMTDHLPVEDKTVTLTKNDSLKTDEILSFRKFKSLEAKNEKTNKVS